MRAINLIPTDERRGAGGAAGRSGGAAYVLLGLLAVLTLVASFYALQKRSVADKRAEVVTLEARAAATEGTAASLVSFTQFAGLRATRTATVSSLAGSRFDWSHALRELARVVPPKTWLTSLQGTVAPGVALKVAAGGQTAALRAALPVPAVEIVGCTTDHRAVAKMMTRMRLIDGVMRVALQASEEGDATAQGSAAGATSGDCRGGVARSPQFAIVAFFDRAVGSVPTTATGRVPAAQILPGGATGATGPTGATP